MYPEALAMFGANQLPSLDKLVMATFPLKQATEAFETLTKGRDEHDNMVMTIMVGD
jgi:hypothetical protein